MFEELFIARQNQLAACPCDGYVEFAVDNVSVFLETVGRQEAELIAVTHRKRIDYHVALAALIAFHGVDADLFEGFYPHFLYLFAYHGNLIAIGNDDSDGLVGIKPLGIEAVNATQKAGYKSRFVGIYLVGNLRIATEFRRNEEHTVAFQRVVEGINGRQGVVELLL